MPGALPRGLVLRPAIGPVSAAEIVPRSIRGRAPVVEGGRGSAMADALESIRVTGPGLAEATGPAPRAEIGRASVAAIVPVDRAEIAPVLAVGIVPAIDRVGSATVAALVIAPEMVRAIVLGIVRATVRVRAQAIVQATAICRGWDRIDRAGTTADAPRVGQAAVGRGIGARIRGGAVVAGVDVRAGERIPAGVRIRGPIRDVGAGITATAQRGVATAGTPGGTVIRQRWLLV